MTNKIVPSVVSCSQVFLLVSAILLLAINAHSQNLNIGARGGISIPNLSSGGSGQTPLSTGYSSRLGADAGIFAEYKITKQFSLQLIAQYSEQGGKKNGLQAFPVPAAIVATYPRGDAPQYLYANYNSETKLNYFMLPLLAKYGWSINKSPWRVYVAAGPFAAFLLSAQQLTSGSSRFYTDDKGQNALPAGVQSFDNTQNVKSSLHTANFGVEGNVGISYRLGQGNIFIEGGGNFGFLNIQRNASDGKNNTGAGTVNLGYSYRFGK